MNVKDRPNLPFLNEALRPRLDAAKAWTPELIALLSPLWAYGVNRIQDIGLRKLVDEFLQERVPVAFYLDPASFSGQWHVPWQNCPHGSMRSIVESCMLIPSMAPAVPGMVDRDRQPISLAVDVALAATLISDSFKADDDGTPTKALHGRRAAEAWREFTLPRRRTPPEIVERVAEASVWHYGIYSPGWTEGQVFTPETQLVHVIDMFTSRAALTLIYEGRKTIG